MLAAADAGADDVERDGAIFQVSSRARAAHGGARGARGGRLHGRVGRAVDGAEDDGRDRRRVDREEGRAAVEALEDNDDVQDVYANFDIPEAVLEAVAS